MQALAVCLPGAATSSTARTYGDVAPKLTEMVNSLEELVTAHRPQRRRTLLLGSSVEVMEAVLSRFPAPDLLYNMTFVVSVLGFLVVLEASTAIC